MSQISPQLPSRGWRRPPLRALALALAAACAGALGGAGPATAASTCAAQGLEVTPLQSSVFYIDIGDDYLSSYVGYRITNTGATARSGLWERLESFTGGVVAPPSGAATTPAVSVDALAAGAATPTYAYLKAPAETTTAQTHDVVLYDGRPGAGGTEVCRETETIVRVLDVIDAAANKVTSASLSSASATLGGTFSLTVDGQTGTIGAGIAEDPGVIRFSPAVAADWPASAFRLIGVTHQVPLGAMPVPAVLSRSNMSGSADYTVTYSFRVVGPTGSATPVVPVSNIASGTQVKHTDPSSLNTLSPIPAVTSSATVTAAAGGSATPGKFAPGAHVPLAATLENDGDGALTVDEVVLRIPSSWTVVAGSADRDGTALPDPFDAGSGELHLVGPFSVPAHGSSRFGVTAAAGPAGSTGTLSAVATLAGGQIDATTDPGDDRPDAVALDVYAAPVAHDDAADAVTGAATTLDVLANDDLDGAAGTLTIVDPPATGTATVVDGGIAYRPDDGQRAPDGLTYRVTTAAGSATGHVALTIVDPPPLADPGDVSTSGVGTAPQSAAIAVPADGSLTLLDAGGQPVTQRTIPGQGTYAVGGGAITFTPVLGYAGTATGVTFRVVDRYGQHAEGTATAHVSAPAPPVATTATSSGAGAQPQQQTVAVPAGGSATLIDADGAPVTTIAVEGIGTYTIEPATGRITFLPATGFVGAAPAVDYAVTDAYGQTTRATYTPTVVAAAGQLTGVPVGPALAPPPAVAPPAPCVSQRAFRIHFRVPRAARVRRVRIAIDGAVAVRLHGHARSARIDLRGRPKELVEVLIVAHLRHGRTLRGTRHYRTCIPHAPAPRLRTLVLHGHHHHRRHHGRHHAHGPILRRGGR